MKLFNLTFRKFLVTSMRTVSVSLGEAVVSRSLTVVVLEVTEAGLGSK